MLKTYFRDITNEIDSVSYFLNTVYIQDVTEEDIKTVFEKASYLEKLFSGLFARGIDKNLKNKIKQFKMLLNVPIPNELDKVENMCDMVMVKFFSLPLSNNVSFLVVQNYLKYCSLERFENLMTYMAEVRSLFLNLCSYLHLFMELIDIESVLLAESWSKMLRTCADGKNQVNLKITEMLHSKSTSKILLKILIQKDSSWKPVQDIIFANVLEKLKSFDKELWSVVIEEETILSDLVEQYSEFVSVTFEALIHSGSKLYFCQEKGEWSYLKDSLFNYQQILSLMKLLLNQQQAKSLANKFFNQQKIVGESELWNSVENDVFSKLLQCKV